MSLASLPLPSDPAALRALAAGLQAELARKELEIAANAAEIHAKTLHIEKLKMQLAVLRRARFGRSSEKLDRDIEPPQCPPAVQHRLAAPAWPISAEPLRSACARG
jgi:transposase